LGEFAWVSPLLEKQAEDMAREGGMDGERLIRNIEDSEDGVERIKWMRTDRSGTQTDLPAGTERRAPSYGDLTTLNTSRLILDSVGDFLLADIVEGFVELLDTSCAVFEKNGDYALSRLSSGWCWFMDHASRRRCSTPDNRAAMESGEWHCHESCWKEAALRSIETKALVDIACRGGIRVFAVPICAGTETVGSISVGYGDPPRDSARLAELATVYGVNGQDLRLQAEGCATRPLFIIEWAKQRVLSAGRIIGEMVERKQAERALRKSEEKFRSLVESTSDWVWEVDKTGAYTYSSPKIRGLLGYEPEEILGKTPFDLMPPAERDRVGRLFQEAIQSRAPLNSIENTNIHKNGHKVDLETSAVPLIDANGNLLGYRGIDRDITERKQVEEALRESESRFKSLVMNSSDTITVLAADGTTKYQSPALKRFFGYEPEDLVGKNVFPYVHPDDLASAQAAFSQLLEHPGKTVSLEYRFRHANGSWITVESVGSNFLDEPGIRGVVLNTRDISERKRTEEALEKRIVALTQPLDDVESISFEDLFNLTELQRLQDLFASVWGVAALITRPDGTPITQPSNFTHFCSEFIRKNEKGSRNCQLSDATLGRHNPSGPIIHKCLSAGLGGAGASITVGGRHIASWLIGQVRNEAQSEAQIMEYARMIGADEAAFREAFLKVPIMEQKTFEQVAHSLFALANQLSTTAYQNIQQARFIAERKRTEVALRESEARYSAVVQHAKDGVIIVQDNILQFVNQSLGDILGYAHEEMENTPFLNYVAPESREIIADRVKERLAGKDAPSVYEAKLIRKDGTIIEVELSASVIQYGGNIAHVGIIRDIADRKRMEEERHKFDIQLREVQKLESLGILAGGIAHDFNNLLMAILGNADLANLSLSPVSPARSYIEEIVRASHRAADLCRQMLAYSGKGRFVVSRYDISEIVREMGQMLDVSISKKAMMRYSLAEGLPAVEADATQMRQVIMNLITNASEAVGDTRGVIAITTGVMECDETYLSESYLDDHLPGGTYVYIEVSDTGCGMDTEAQRRIFDPFFTTKFTGRGLGLAAVLGIVRGHKGAIKVYSEAGKGTTFKILLPAVEWQPGERVKTVEESTPLQGGGTILLIDDDPFVRTVASAMLAQLGFQVLTAVNGREGLKIFRTHGAEITGVILDLMMPEMGGEEAFLELRKLRSDVRVILSSGYNEQDVTQRFVGKGLSGFVQKPYTVANLRSALKRALG
jgi:PAS domain S-box-containing protein